MRPLSIGIEGLRSFRSEVVIDFGSRTQMAVIGDTGAGKSSILEAMTYALYGQTSIGSRAKQELMNDTSDVMRVVLRFQVSGEEWEVARVDRRTGAGGLRPAQAQLVRYGPDGETLEKVEQVRSVNERVQEVIGLDSDAFLRTVILPQGRFARLLVEDAPSARTDILRQVWRTQELEAAGELAKRRLDETGTLALRLRDEVDRHPEDPREHLAGLTSGAAEADRKSDALADLGDRCTRAAKAIRQAKATISAADAAEDRVKPATMEELAGRLAPVETAQRRMDAEEKKLQKQEDDLKREFSGLPTDDGPDDSEVARALAALEALPAQVERALSAAEALRGAIDGEARAASGHVQAQQAVKSAAKLEGAHQALEAPLAGAVDSARDALADAKRWHGKSSDLQEQISSTQEALVGRGEQVREATTRLGEAQRELQGVREHLQRTERTLSETQRANAAATAAHGLCTGDECPVCGSDLPEDWTPPQDTGLDAARDACEDARRLAADAGEAVVAAEAQRSAVQSRVDEAEKELKGLRSRMVEALEQLRSAAGLDDPSRLAVDAPLPAEEDVLAAARKRFRDAEAKLEEHRGEAEELREARTAAEMAEKTAAQARRHAIKDRDRTREEGARELDRLNRSIRSVSPPFRPELSLPSDPAKLESVDTTPLARATSEARDREEILRQRKQEHDRLHGEIEGTRTALQRLGDARATDVEKPLQDLVRALADHRTALADAVRELDADIPVPAAIHYPVDARALRQWIAGLREAMARAVKLAAAERRRARDEDKEARAEAARIAERLDPPADPTDIEALVKSAKGAAADADYAARRAAAKRDEFAAIVDDILRLKETAEEAAALELALGDLNASLQSGAFLKWLTLRRSRDLLVYASRMLGEMTAGRYGFADPGSQDDQQWLVVDNDSGQARSPASLSGGEQFIGSLALALGMVEMMARSGGRLESLFLDEGFGSLDRNNLDSAIEALSLVAGTGRMVGVISHVGAVAEQVDDVLAVTRGATGSRAAWLSHAQRRELARSDVDLEGASALAGLLE